MVAADLSDGQCLGRAVLAGGSGLEDESVSSCELGREFVFKGGHVARLEGLVHLAISLLSSRHENVEYVVFKAV